MMENASCALERTSSSDFDSDLTGRRIFNQRHLKEFLGSSTFKKFMQFIGNLCSSSAGFEIVKPDIYRDESCVYIKVVLEVLSDLEQMLKDYPPSKQTSRFGNAAFKDWLDAVRQRSQIDMKRFSETKWQELSCYWCASFGNDTRLDYGSGHEASFLVWLYSLYSLGLFDNEDANQSQENIKAVALCIFPVYINLVRTVQTTYRLEPAGSHGVWSLDDYQFFPFLLGASQLTGSNKTYSNTIAPSPRSARHREVVDELQEKNLFMCSLKHISIVKTGAFRDHSPLLTDICELVYSWNDVYAGFLKMFEAVVMGKLPVAQHFLFGSLFPCTWELLESEKQSLDRNRTDRSSAGIPSMSPFQLASQSSPGGDPLRTFFGIDRKPITSRRENTLLSSINLSTSDFAKPVASEDVKHELLGDSGIRIGGWKILSNKTRVSGDQEIDNIKARFQSDANELDFPLPEMFFGANYLRFTHEQSGLILEFCPHTAVFGCKIRYDDTGCPDRVVRKLPIADRWQGKKDPAGNIIKEWRKDYDWTYATTYQGDFYRIDDDDATGDRQEKIERIPTKEGIDYQLLKRRDKILYFDNVLLFEDDLFDFGEGKYSVKLRVMPTCFFALARSWTRVDSSFVRCFDLRVFHLFDSDKIILENSCKELLASDIVKLGRELKIMMNEEEVYPLMKLVSTSTQHVLLPKPKNCC